MSVFDYIQEQKAKFQAKREAIRTARHEDKQEALLELRKQRKKLEAIEKTNQELLEEKQKIRELKQESFNRSLGGKIFENMKKKIREGKAQGNVFTGSGRLNPIFHGTSGDNIFSKLNPDNKEKKETKAKIIIIK